MTQATCWKLFRALLGILETVVYTFTLFGWPAFVYIFIEERFYDDRCSFDSTANGSDCKGLGNCTLETPGKDRVQKCAEQEEMLNLVYTVAMVGLVSTPVLGYVYDHCGLVCVRILSICLSAGGFLLMALAERGTEWLLFPGAVFHLLGGFQLTVTDVQVAVLFPKAQATLTCLISGASDASGFVPTLIKMAYQAGVSYKTCMFTFTGIILLISSVNTFTLPPRQDVDGNNVDVACCLKICKRQRSANIPPKPNNGTGTNVDETGVYELATNETSNEYQTMEQGWSNAAYVPDNVNLTPTLEPFCPINQETCDVHSMEIAIPALISNGKANGKASQGKSKEIDGQHCVKDTTCSQHKGNVNHKETCVDGSSHMMCEVENSISKDDTKNTNSGLLYGTLVIFRMPIFWVLMLWLLCQDALIITYQGSFYAIINYYGKDDKSKVSTYTDVYAWFQVGSLFWALMAGLMLDKLVARTTKDDKGGCFMVPFFLTVLAGLIVSIASIVPIIELQFVAILSHSVLKTGSYAVHMAFVASTFPREHFGKTYGIQYAVSSAFNFIHYPIFSWYKHSLGSDPLWLGVLFIGICLTASCLPFYLLWRRCRSTISYSSTHTCTITANNVFNSDAMVTSPDKTSDEL